MIDFSLIHEKVCIYFNVDYIYPFIRDKKTKRIYIRQIFHYLCKNLNNDKVSFNDIGCYLSDITEPFSHSTIIHSYKKVEGYLTYDKQIIKDIDNILNMLPKNE